MWTVEVPISPPEDKKGFEEEVRRIVAKLGAGIGGLKVNAEEISGEWQGVQRVPHEKASRWTKEEQYAELEQDTKDRPVILYLHGGAYIVCTPDTHRQMTFRYARECGGARVFSVRYRLAPQHQFPAALVDAILAYKYLIDPPPGALHAAVDPSKIVIAGDSAGGCLFYYVADDRVV